MKTAPRRSPLDRDRAIARLRAITIGTTIASSAAVGGFGAIAARSYDGSVSDVTTAALDTTSSASSATDPTTSTTGVTTSDAATTGATTATPSDKATAAPTTSTGAAHAATGSS